MLQSFYLAAACKEGWDQLLLLHLELLVPRRPIVQNLAACILAAMVAGTTSLFFCCEDTSHLFKKLYITSAFRHLDWGGEAVPVPRVLAMMYKRLKDDHVKRRVRRDLKELFGGQRLLDKSP